MSIKSYMHYKTMEFVVKEETKYEWKKSAVKFFLPVLTALVLAGGAAVISQIEALGLQSGSLEFLIAGLVIGGIKAGLNWYKNWYKLKKQ